MISTFPVLFLPGSDDFSVNIAPSLPINTRPKSFDGITAMRKVRQALVICCSPSLKIRAVYALTMVWHLKTVLLWWSSIWFNYFYDLTSSVNWYIWGPPPLAASLGRRRAIHTLNTFEFVSTSLTFFSLSHSLSSLIQWLCELTKVDKHSW